MARGRHRVSPALHRRTAPLAVAGISVAVAAGAWIAPAGPHDAVPRGMVALAASGAVLAAYLMRRWDRLAGRQVHELTTARSRDEWHAEERHAELEGELEEAREIRQRLEEDLRSRRAELTRLRGEHADLLRRYARAETERARVLESRRRLAIESAAPARAIAPPTAGPLSAAAFDAADAALLNLARNAARQQAQRTVEAARQREAAAGAEGEERPGRHAQPPAGRPHPEPPSGPGGLPSRAHHLVPAVASAVLPYAQPPRPGRTVGGFDFFGHKPEARRPARAEHPAVPAAPRPPSGPAPQQRTGVVDLTAHDDTDALDVRELRSHG